MASSSHIDQRFTHHIFICINKRESSDPRGCCSAKGSEALRQLFKDELKCMGLKGRVRANAAGCLDYCAMGPTVVIYPEGIWYSVKTPDDVHEILQRHVLKGEVVDRLRIPHRPAKPAGAPPS